MSDVITVLDRGQEITFSFPEMLKYAGPHSPGGVAHAFKVLERALPLLEPDGPPERREIEVGTAFGGPGARDAFELVTRAVTGERYTVEDSLARPELGNARERFSFALAYRARSLRLALRAGYVTDEFIALARKKEPTAADDRRLDALKLELANLVMSAPATDVYDVIGAP
ncbi:MAG: hypothetical protein ACR2IP_06295 [Solirubrobacteraceae bacterium]